MTPKPKAVLAAKKDLEAARQAKAASLQTLMQWTSKLQNILPPEAGLPKIFGCSEVGQNFEKNGMRTWNSEEAFDMLEVG